MLEYDSTALLAGVLSGTKLNTTEPSCVPVEPEDSIKNSTHHFFAVENVVASLICVVISVVLPYLNLKAKEAAVDAFFRDSNNLNLTPLLVLSIQLGKENV